MLEVIGIDPEAERLFEALLGSQPATAGELVGAAGLPRQRLRVALRTLMAHGLVNRVSGSPVRYSAGNPAVVLEVLLLKREHELKRAQIRSQELAERFHHAASSQDPAELVEVVTGRQAVLQRVVHALRSARHELRAFDKPPYTADPIAPNEDEFDLLGRGGSARSIYERAAIEIHGRKASFERGMAAGEQARVLPTLPMKLFLIDDRIAIVPLQAAPKAVESCVVVYGSALLEAISALFELLWEQALPLELASADCEHLDQPSAEEGHILTLLTAGLPDEAIARQLGLSDRTYQRRIRRLMERLHVQTRFQLALQATRRGWLDGTAR